MTKRFPVVALVALVALAAPALGGITVYEEGDKKIEIGGRVQLQYYKADPDDGESTDDLFFRRLRPYIAGTVTENWMGKIQIDFGKAGDDDEVAVKDAYLQYKKGNIKVTVGNAKHGFSREFLTSSKRQQLIERSFVGDHNYASPDRVAGVKVEGKAESGKLSWAVGAGSESHDPDVDKLDFDTPVNGKDDWNEGRVVSGRVDFHPLGKMAFDQGDFRSDEWKVTVGAGGFAWSNDDDNNTYTDPDTDASLSDSKADLDSADGIEISAGVRGRGFSADAEYQTISGDTVVEGFHGGIYMDGKAELDLGALEAGYMVHDQVEIVAGYDSLDADAYEDTWTRTSFGVNFFVNKHKLKLQATYRTSDSVEGDPEANGDELFVQAQFVF